MKSDGFRLMQFPTTNCKRLKEINTNNGSRSRMVPNDRYFNNFVTGMMQKL